DFHTDENSMEVTLSALKLLAKTLAGYPGRKNLLWVSEAFPVSLTIEGVPQGSSTNAALASRAGPTFERDGNTGSVQKQENPNDLQELSQANSQGGAHTQVSPGKGHSYATELAL